MRLIAIDEFCNHHGIEKTLIQEFAEFGLIQLHIQDDQTFIPDTLVLRLERAMRLATDLGVNKEGIEIILNMREELKQLRRKASLLHYRLKQLEAQQHLHAAPQNQNTIIDLQDLR